MKKFLKHTAWFLALLGFMWFVTYIPGGPYVNALIVLIALWDMADQS